MKSRIVIIFLGVITVWSFLLFRGVYLQVLPNAKLEKLNKKQFLKKVKVPGRRGAILDRNGEVLAVSLTSYSLFADPKIIKKPKEVAKKISRLLKVPYRKVYRKIGYSRARRKAKKRQRRFVWIQRKLEKKDRDIIKSWNIRGLGFIEEDKRVYPNEGMLAQVLGFVSSDGRGLEGLEKQYQKILVGKDKWVEVRRDAKGRPLLLDTDWVSEDFDGKDIYLTIDRNIQFHLEKELKTAVSKYSAKSAVGVVLDAKTSEVLAMANIPTFDLNKAFAVKSRGIKRNRAVTDAFEPGSTLKTIAVAAGLKNELLTPNKKYFCENGAYRIGKRVIREADARHRFGWLTVSEILARSSNIGTSKIAEELTAETYRKELLNFGFGRKTGIDFPGETRGILNRLPWKQHLLSNISFGHGVSVSPLQLTAAYAAIANKGEWNRPRFLDEKSFTSVYGNTENGRSKNKARQVLSKKDAELMSLMLTSVTGEGGTGKNARVPGFLVGGKTGTAQRVRDDGRGYLKNAYISSFAGFAPSSDPRFVIYVAVDSPKKTYYGSQVAAPIFAKIASYAIRDKALSPVVISNSNLYKDKLIDKRIETKKKSSEALQAIKKTLVKENIVPDLRGLTLREVLSHVKDKDIKIKTQGHGVVSKLIPSEGKLLPKNKTIKLFLKE